MMTPRRGPAEAALVHVRRWRPIFIAGLCKAVNGVVYATMVTTAAAPEMKWLHHRMPRVLVSGERVGEAVVRGALMVRATRSMRCAAGFRVMK